MKVAIITERANVSLGGAERSVSELTGALSVAGHDVSVLAATGAANEGNMHILCPDNRTRRVDHTAFCSALKEHLKLNHYDIVHSVLPVAFADIYQPRGGTYAESVVRNAASYEGRVIRIWKRHTAFINRHRTRLLAAERLLCQGETGPVIAALSQYVAQQIDRHYRTPGERVAVVSNGVRTDRSVDGERAGRIRSQILAQLHTREQSNPVLFLFAANNFRLKGLAPLIRAMSVATKRVQQNMCLVVVGRGKAHKYRHLAERLNVHDRVVFLGPVDNIQNILSITDVAVLPTFYDPSSRFILEALVHGKPVITTRYNGARDLFDNQRHGLVVGEPTDVAGLANAIAYFSRRDNIEAASQAILADDLKQRISISRVVQELVRLYESVLERKGGK